MYQPEPREPGDTSSSSYSQRLAEIQPSKTPLGPDPIETPLCLPEAKRILIKGGLTETAPHFSPKRL